MICAPARSTSSGCSPRTAPYVPTGMKAGVGTGPWGRARVAARAAPWVPAIVNSNIPQITSIASP
jgi:hypothetical protein